jgi:DNA-directed RNA polymerase subunit K/omega
MEDEEDKQNIDTVDLDENESDVNSEDEDEDKIKKDKDDDDNESDDDEDEDDKNPDTEKELDNDSLQINSESNVNSKKTDSLTNNKYQYSIYDHEIEDLDDTDFKKFDDEVKKNYIVSQHSECLNKNFNEIKTLSKITRNSSNIIIDEFHKTLPILTKYEKTKILGMRLKQLNNNSKPYIIVNEKIIDNYIIANMELEQKKLPFIIERPLPNNTFEYWKLKDLDLIN